MVPREHVYHIEGCQFITEIHILKVRLRMSELLIFSLFFYFLILFLFVHLFSYLFIIIIHYYYYMHYYCLFFRFYYPVLGSGGGKKTNKQKTPDPFSFTYSTTLCGRYKYEKANMKKIWWMVVTIMMVMKVVVGMGWLHWNKCGLRQQISLSLSRRGEYSSGKPLYHRGIISHI